jgi:competence protein ComEA
MRKLIIILLAVILSGATVQAQPVGQTAPQTQGTQAATINVNTATIEQLMTIKGIGQVTAQNILDYRTANGPFQTVNDLDKVKGIGPAKLEGMKPFISVN